MMQAAERWVEARERRDLETLATLTAVPSFPPPTESGIRLTAASVDRLPESVRLLAPELWWDHGQPLYDAGKYAEAADKGLDLIETRGGCPDHDERMNECYGGSNLLAEV